MTVNVECDVLVFVDVEVDVSVTVAPRLRKFFTLGNNGLPERVVSGVVVDFTSSFIHVKRGRFCGGVEL